MQYDTEGHATRWLYQSRAVDEPTGALVPAEISDLSLAAPDSTLFSLIYKVTA